MPLDMFWSRHRIGEAAVRLEDEWRFFLLSSFCGAYHLTSFFPAALFIKKLGALLQTINRPLNDLTAVTILPFCLIGLCSRRTMKRRVSRAVQVVARDAAAIHTIGVIPAVGSWFTTPNGL